MSTNARTREYCIVSNKVVLVAFKGFAHIHGIANIGVDVVVVVVVVATEVIFRRALSSVHEELIVGVVKAGAVVVVDVLLWGIII